MVGSARIVTGDCAWPRRPGAGGGAALLARLRATDTSSGGTCPFSARSSMAFRPGTDWPITRSASTRTSFGALLSAIPCAHDTSTDDGSTAAGAGG